MSVKSLLSIVIAIGSVLALLIGAGLLIMMLALLVGSFSALMQGPNGSGNAGWFLAFFVGLAIPCIGFWAAGVSGIRFVRRQFRRPVSQMKKDSAREDYQQEDSEPTSRGQFSLSLVALVEELNLAPRNTLWNRVIAAFVGPALLTVWGVYVMVAQRAAIYNPFFKIIGRPTVVALGTSAMLAGGALVALAAFVHFRCFWYLRNAAAGAVGMIASLLIAILLAVLASLALVCS
jgi:MFS family permease